VIGTAGFSVPAFATKLSDKRAEAAAAQAKLDDLRSKAEVASEAYNEARDKYVALSAEVRDTRSKISDLKAEQATLQEALGNRADEMYRSDGALGVIEMLLSARNLEDFNSVIELLQRVSEQDAATVAKLKATRTKLEIAERTLAAQEADALAQSQAMEANAAQAKEQVAAAEQMLAGLKSDIRALIAEQQAAAEAAAKARYEASHPSSDSGGDPPSSSKGALAVWWAMKALGSPYRWGASGPDRFDCSGLTMWAYGHAGINLPHYSQAQYSSGPHVAKGNLEPGDLVFFGNPIHHVGMYVGGGDFIEAPYTGARVRITSLSGRSDYAGATRP